MTPLHFFGARLRGTMRRFRVMHCVGATACLILCAQTPPEAEAPFDPHIQIVDYSPGRVYPLLVAPGFVSVIEFAADELVESVIVGNGGVWQISQTDMGNRIIVKPLSGAVSTNLIAVTNMRRYVFTIYPDKSGQDAYILKFDYGGVAVDSPRTLQAGHYKLRGSRKLRPKSISDDGRNTYIDWDKDTSLPGVFGFDEDGREMILNGLMTKRGYKIEGIHSRILFKFGREKLTASRIEPRASR
jgi:type IV secretion system protein VirB9